MRKGNWVLLQVRIDKAVRDKLDRLARATGRRRGPYVERLLTYHVETLRPKVAKALEKAALGAVSAGRRE